MATAVWMGIGAVVFLFIMFGWAIPAMGKAYDKHIGMPDDEAEDQEHA